MAPGRQPAHSHPPAGLGRWGGAGVSGREGSSRDPPIPRSPWSARWPVWSGVSSGLSECLQRSPSSQATAGPGRPRASHWSCRASPAPPGGQRVPGCSTWARGGRSLVTLTFTSPGSGGSSSLVLWFSQNCILGRTPGGGSTSHDVTTLGTPGLPSRRSPAVGTGEVSGLSASPSVKRLPLGGGASSFRGGSSMPGQGPV